MTGPEPVNCECGHPVVDHYGGCEFCACRLPHDASLAIYVATERDRAVAEALRQAADTFESDAANAWGGSAAWLTSGDKVAQLVAGWLREDADEIDSRAPESDE